MPRCIISGNWGLEISQCPLSSVKRQNVVQLKVSLLELADTSGLCCLQKFNYKRLICISFYWFKKWTFVKLRELYTYRTLKCISSYIFLFIKRLSNLLWISFCRALRVIFNLPTNFKGFHSLRHLTHLRQVLWASQWGVAVDKDRTAFEQSKC